MPLKRKGMKKFIGDHRSRPVLTTEFSQWIWNVYSRSLTRIDLTDPLGTSTTLPPLGEGENNITGATKKAARREYDRLLNEQNSAEERMV